MNNNKNFSKNKRQSNIFGNWPIYCEIIENLNTLGHRGPFQACLINCYQLRHEFTSTCWKFPFRRQFFSWLYSQWQNDHDGEEEKEEQETEKERERKRRRRRKKMNRGPGSIRQENSDRIHFFERKQIPGQRQCVQFVNSRKRIEAWLRSATFILIHNYICIRKVSFTSLKSTF